MIIIFMIGQSCPQSCCQVVRFHHSTTGQPDNLITGQPDNRTTRQPDNRTTLSF